MQQDDLDPRAQPTGPAAMQPQAERETCIDTPWGEVRPYALFVGLHPAGLAIGGDDASGLARRGSGLRIVDSGEDQRGRDRE